MTDMCNCLNKPRVLKNVYSETRGSTREVMRDQEFDKALLEILSNPQTSNGTVISVEKAIPVSGTPIAENPKIARTTENNGSFETASSNANEQLKVINFSNTSITCATRRLYTNSEKGEEMKNEIAFVLLQRGSRWEPYLSAGQIQTENQLHPIGGTRHGG